MADFVLREALATPEKTSRFGETPKDEFTTYDIPTKSTSSAQYRSRIRIQEFKSLLKLVVKN
jgi:hypothetical protein